MVGPGLKLRYVFAVLLVGALLTAGVAAITHLSEQRERDQLAAVEEWLGALAQTDPRLESPHAELRDVVARAYDNRVLYIVGAGTLLTLLAALVVALMISRIDRALGALMVNTASIGRGRYAEPVAVSGVAEVAALERSLESMRRDLAATTISRDHLDDVLNGMSDAVLVLSPDGQIQTSNAAAAGLFGLGIETLLGTTFADLVAPEHRAAFDLERLRAEPGETVIRNERGQTIPVSVHLSSLSRGAGDTDRGTHRRAARHHRPQARRAAHPLPRALRHADQDAEPDAVPAPAAAGHHAHRARGRGLALLYIDVDNFKEINDTFGHETGDRVLETLAERLARALPRESVAGRLAGDEFAIFAEGISTEQARHDQARNLARLVLAEVAKPLHLPGQEIDITASIGIALVPEHADNVIDLIRNADAAMYHAKRQGRNCHVFYVARDERRRGRAPAAEEQAAARARARRVRAALPAQGGPARAAQSWAPRRCCAGACPATARSRRRSSSRWRRSHG